MQKINQKYINTEVKKALLEDLFPKGDLTTNLVSSKNKIIKAKIIAKQNGIISGLNYCKTAFKLIGKETVFKQKIKDGNKIKRNEVIAEINSLDEPFEEGLSVDNQSTVRKNPVRGRNTSTENNILDLYVPSLDWPPRLPSQEREEVSFLFPNSPYLLSIQYFPSLTHKMDEVEYLGRLKSIKLATLKVESCLKRFVPSELTAEDTQTYNDRLKEIRANLDAYDELNALLLVDLDDSNNIDQRRITSLLSAQNDLSKKVMDNEREVKVKIGQLRQDIPLSKFEIATKVS